MRTMIAITLSAGLALLAGSSFAADTAQQGTMKSCAASWKAVPDGDKAKTKYKDYMSGCMKKPATAPAPAMAMKPAAAPTMAMTPMKPAPTMAMKPMKPAAAKVANDSAGSAKCKDGKIVAYKHRSGTCSGHGGVGTWL